MAVAVAEGSMPITGAPSSFSEVRTEAEPESQAQAQAHAQAGTESKTPASNAPIYIPECTHPSMTRVYYGRRLCCAICRKPGPWGWLFRCTLDREEMIEHYHKQGIFRVGFDDVGDCLVDQFLGNGPRKGTAAARQDIFGFLKEVTSGGPTTYSPAQISLVLQQRGNVKRILEKHHEDHPWAPPPMPPPLGIDAALELEKMRGRPLWVPPDGQECQFKVCAGCRPSFRDRAYLSLDGILHGDVPPTAASGFGYHLLRQRPVADADVVRNLGLRHSKPPQSSKDARPWRGRRARETAAAKAWQGLAARMISRRHVDRPDLGTPSRAHQSKPNSLGVGGKASSNTKSGGNGAAVEQATHVPLPGPSKYEELSLEGKATSMMSREDEAGVFSSMPLEVDGGVAVTEEGVTKGIADMITQV